LHAQRLVRPAAVVPLEEGVEPGLLLEHVGGGGLGGFGLQGEMHAFVAAVPVGMAGLDARGLESGAQASDGGFSWAVEGVGRGKGHAVVGANDLRETKFFEGALEDGEGELLLCRGQRLTREQVAAGEVGDRQRVAVVAVAEHELAFVISTPEGVRFGGPAELGTLSAMPPATAAFDEAMPVEDSVDGANCRQMR